ncbi:Calpastatin OS=Afipia felis OX=1035 GN=BN961_03543 PE=4 SV=1 [Afipia felis]
MTGRDGADLQRFIDAQWPLYDRVLCELRTGQKRTHWMWFIFPQIEGLGSSAMAQKYAIASREEAAAYLGHPLLGGRLEECTALVNAIADKSVHEIFGSPDDLKFGSSMTLFAEVAKGHSLFKEAVEKYFGGRFDDATLARIGPRIGRA